MHVRLGDLLVERGAISADQRDLILAAQETRRRPFGAMAEEFFGVSPMVVEEAWARQYAFIAPRIDPRGIEIDPAVLALIDRRQAWQFGVIPIRHDEGGLELVTSPDSLARAIRFCGWRVAEACSFAICEASDLPVALEIHYPIGGLDAQFISRVMGLLSKAG